VKQKLLTVRFTCDGWYYDPNLVLSSVSDPDSRMVVVHCKQRRDFPNDTSLTLVGTHDEIREQFERMGWTVAPHAISTVTGSYTNDPVEASHHLCTRVHYQ